jgi:hypothetical protein
MRRKAVLLGMCASLGFAGLALAQNDVVVKNGRYKGFTKQGHYIHWKLDASGDYITKLAYKLKETCSNGTSNMNTFSMSSGTAATIAEDEHHFKGTQNLVANNKVKSGYVKISGKFTDGQHAQGKIKDQIVFRKNDPNKRGSCSGQSKFTVHLK